MCSSPRCPPSYFHENSIPQRTAHALRDVSVIQPARRPARSGVTIFATRPGGVFGRKGFFSTVAIMATRAPRSASRMPAGPKGAEGAARRDPPGARNGSGNGSGNGARNGSGDGRQAGGQQARQPPPPGRRRPRRTGTGRGPASRGRASRGSASRGRARGAAARRPSDPFLIMFGWIANVLAGAWMVAAHGAGFAARAIGRGTRDLDPLHRRDGIGLALLGAAIVTAAALWWHLGSAAGHVLWAVVSGAFGALAWSVPLLLALLSWRYLRHPDRNAETGRIVIGWSALLAGALGLVHIANGTPTPTAGAAVMRSAGGLIGFFTSAPLVAAVTSWVATPLLALLCVFGLLVITATPVHRIGDRIAELRSFIRGEHPASADAAAGAADPQAGPQAVEKGARRGHLLRGTRSRKGVIEPGEHQKPYDTPLLSGGGAGEGRPAPLAADARAALSGAQESADEAGRPAAQGGGTEELLGALGFGPRPGDRPRGGPRGGQQRDPTIAAGPPGATVRGSEQLTLTGAANGSYTLPPAALFRPGSAPKMRTRANDAVVAAL